MIALGPARALETEGTPGDSDGREQQSEKRNAKKTQDGHAAFHLHGIGNGCVLGINFGLDAQVIMTSGNARDDDRILPAAFGPGTVAVGAVVVTDFAAEIPSLASVLIDECIIQIDPGIRNARGSRDFHIGCAAFYIKRLGDEGSFTLWLARVQAVA